MGWVGLGWIKKNGPMSFSSGMGAEREIMGITNENRKGINLD